MTDKMLADWIVNHVNEGNRRTNAIPYDSWLYEKTRDITIAFQRNHEQWYKALLAFCVENDGIIICTEPATYRTTVRVKRTDV